MYKKSGYPEKGELVLCTVKNLAGHSAFLTLDEYKHKEGMLHTNEIERRWQRKMKSKLKPGTKVVCKVMRVDKKKGHINLSQKRVGAAQNRNKQAEYKNEKSADQILHFFARESNMSEKEVYEKIGDKILDEYGLLYPALLDVAKGKEEVLKGLKIKKELAQKFVEFVKKRMNIPKKQIVARLRIKSLAGDGVGAVKEAVAGAKKLAEKHDVEFDLQYLGAPKYKLVLTMEEYKVGEQAYKEIKEFLKDFVGKHKGEVSFKR